MPGLKKCAACGAFYEGSAVYHVAQCDASPSPGTVKDRSVPDVPTESLAERIYRTDDLLDHSRVSKIASAN